MNNLGATEKDLIESRKKKLEELKSMGINPYPSVSSRSISCKEITEDKALVDSDKEVVAGGRLLALRGHGKLVFGDLADESGQIQIVLKSDVLEDDFKLVSLLDLGDFIEIKGTVFITKAGELSLLAKKLKVLTKAIRPLPDQFHGLKDQELRYRERYVDLMMNKDVKEKFYLRSNIIKAIREFMLEKSFFEVDTPVLQPIPGGASAKPFVTHYNAYDRDVFLRIAPELYLKRLLVGGFEKVFEFARCFRNEGVDATHNPEFTNFEFYWAYADYEKMMDLVEELIRKIIKEINNGEMVYEIDGKKIDFSQKFARKTFAEISQGKNSDEAFKKGLTEIIEPTFVINHPTELIPLAKRNEKNPDVVDSFQLVIAGMELAKAFSELNDPIDQRERFVDQMKLREKGDEEAQMLDEDFLKAIEYGMPPTSGCGIGIDRLVRVLSNSKTLREILLFPYMRPAQSEIGKSETQNSKSETKLVAVVLNKSSNLENWQKMNAVAHLSVSFAGRTDSGLFSRDTITTKDSQNIRLNMQDAIMIRESDSSGDLIDLIKSAKEKELKVFEFTREMLETTDDKKIIEITSQKNFNQLDLLGVIVYGKKSTIEEITNKFQLAK